MKRLLCLTLTIFVLIGLLITIPFTAFAGPKVLKLATPYGISNSVMDTSKWFAKELEKRTNGRYTLKSYYSGSMGKAPDLPSLCAKGIVDFIVTGVGYTPSIFQMNRGFELMYITENPYAQERAVWEMYHNYAPVRAEWDKNGLIYGFYNSCSNMVAQSKIPIRTVADLKGVKIRAYAAVGKLIKKLGGIPVALSYGEIYDALNRGLIEGAFGLPYFNLYGSRFWEIAHYVIDTGVGVYCLVPCMISKKTYESFPPDIKKIVDQLREDANAQHCKWMAIHENKVVTGKVVDKVEYIIWSPDEKAKARKMTVPYIWEDWINESKKAGLPADEFLDTYKKLLKKYEKQYPYDSPYDYALKLKKKQ